MSIPVFLASDDNYAPFVASTIASICSHTKSFCDFYILDGGISEKNKEKICKLKEQFDNFFIEFLFVDLEKEFKNIVYKNAGSYISLSTYKVLGIPVYRETFAANKRKFYFLGIKIFSAKDKD